MRFVNYLYFGSTGNSEKAYKAYIISEEPYINKEEFKRVENEARMHIYGEDADENMVPILFSVVTVVEGC